MSASTVYINVCISAICEFMMFRKNGLIELLYAPCRRMPWLILKSLGILRRTAADGYNVCLIAAKLRYKSLFECNVCVAQFVHDVLLVKRTF